MVIAPISPKLPHAYLSRTYVYKGGGNNLFQPKVESLIAAVNLIGESGTCFAVSLARKYLHTNIRFIINTRKSGGMRNSRRLAFSLSQLKT